MSTILRLSFKQVIFNQNNNFLQMRYSSFFGRTKLEAPHDTDSTNARLLTQAGFIDKVGAGIYNLMPLGLRVFQKISQIIREEMDAVGGQELLMPALHPIDLWKTTGRDQTMDDVLYPTKGAGGKDFVLGPSHEETVTPMAGKFINSYKDLPFVVYQLQTKFRDEPRAKSGLLRGREFGMKDMYSFHTTKEDLDEYYEKVKEAYLNVYNRCGLKAYIVDAPGGAFTDEFTHEFSVLSPSGEDTILLCPKCSIAKNIEVVENKDEAKCTKCDGPLTEEKAIEAGNIFKLGTKYTSAFNVKYTDKDGKQKEAIMGCYGIGTTRLIGTIVEISHDEQGMIWPKSVAPYLVHLISLGKDEKVIAEADKLYDTLVEAGVEVLYDDRDESAGKKFNDADLIGLPVRLLVSGRTLEKNGVEFKLRTEKDGNLVEFDEVLDKVLG
jgi:prolyl-tRNA synthetase